MIAQVEPASQQVRVRVAPSSACHVGTVRRVHVLACAHTNSALPTGVLRVGNDISRTRCPRSLE